MARTPSPSPAHIASRILLIRRRKVMIDADLAQFYGVTTKRLNEQVRRNHDRFADYFFQLTAADRSEVVANCDHLARLKVSPTLPYASTEHGALMAASGRRRKLPYAFVDHAAHRAAVLHRNFTMLIMGLRREATSMR